MQYNLEKKLVTGEIELDKQFKKCRGSEQEPKCLVQVDLESWSINHKTGLLC